MPDDLDLTREAFIIRPGDHLLIRFDRALTSQQAAEIKAMLTERLPGLAGVTILSAAAQVCVYRPESEPRA